MPEKRNYFLIHPVCNRIISHTHFFCIYCSGWWVIITVRRLTSFRVKILISGWVWWRSFKSSLVESRYFNYLTAVTKILSGGFSVSVYISVSVSVFVSVSVYVSVSVSIYVFVSVSVYVSVSDYLFSFYPNLSLLLTPSLSNFFPSLSFLLLRVEDINYLTAVSKILSVDLVLPLFLYLCLSVSKCLFPSFSLATLCTLYSVQCTLYTVQLRVDILIISQQSLKYHLFSILNSQFLCLSFCLSFCRSVCLSVFLSLNVYFHLFLSLLYVHCTMYIVQLRVDILIISQQSLKYHLFSILNSQFLCLSFCLSFCRSVCLSVSKCLFPSFSLATLCTLYNVHCTVKSRYINYLTAVSKISSFLYLKFSVSLSVFLPVFLPVFLSVCLSVCLYVCLPVFLSVCLYLNVYFHLFLSLLYVQLRVGILIISQQSLKYHLFSILNSQFLCLSFCLSLIIYCHLFLASLYTVERRNINYLTAVSKMSSFLSLSFSVCLSVCLSLIIYFHLFSLTTLCTVERRYINYLTAYQNISFYSM